MTAPPISYVLRLAGTILVACAAPASIRAEAPRTTASEARDGQHDFDFMFGRWKIQVRRLRNPLHGSHELVRYVWSDITANSGHFEQSYSADGGRTWEANWVAQSTRIE